MIGWYCAFDFIISRVAVTETWSVLERSGVVDLTRALGATHLGVVMFVSKKDLAVELKRLLVRTERRGKLKRAALARAVGVSPSSLYAYLDGTTLPPVDVLERLLDVLDIPDSERRQLVAARDALDLRTYPEAHDATEPAPVVPRQLPAPAPMFTGRAPELSVLDEISDMSTVVITAIDGMAGIGKTALAVYAAHRIADRYPSGHLFVDLHGHTPGTQPLAPAQALDYLLRALGVPGAEIPAGQDERAALYRTRLAEQRMLILLDNAAGETQVAPLLPGSPGCLVLITSRRRLTGLDHTTTLSLDTLPIPDAVTLLTQTTSTRQLLGQPPSLLIELVELCGRLPLAIRIAAARLRAHSAWTLPHLVERLRDQRARLDELAAGHRSVTAALDLSYQHLSPDQQHTYRLLGLHPGPDIDVYATAALLDSTSTRAGRLLDQLLDAHLLQEPAAGRFQFHDLTRDHAATCGHTEPAASAALSRLLDYYRHRAALAMDAVYPYERARRPQVPATHTPGPDLSEQAAALSWLDTELPNLLAAARYATDHGDTELVMHLSAVLHRHFRSRSRCHDAETLHEQALDAASVAGDQTGQLDVLNSLAVIYWQQGKYEQAADHYRQALQLARAGDHRANEVAALTGLGDINWLRGRHEQATEHYEDALRIARTSGDRLAELRARTGLGHIYRQQERHAPAIDHFEQILRIARTIGHRPAELTALVGLGHIHRQHGQFSQAVDRYQQLLDLAHDSGDRNFEFEAWQAMGRLRHATGDLDSAIALHDRALRRAGELNQPADQARAHDGLAHAHHTRGHHEQARDHWQHALNILTRAGIDHTEEKETTATAIRTHLASLEVVADTSRT